MIDNNKENTLKTSIISIKALKINQKHKII